MWRSVPFTTTISSVPSDLRALVTAMTAAVRTRGGPGRRSRCYRYGMNGPEHLLVRGDIVYFSTENVGAQFSSSSMSRVLSLHWNAYSNNVAAMTVNVIKGFAQDGPLDDI